MTEKITAYDDSYITITSDSSDPHKLYHELRAMSKDTTIGKDERNIAHREAERLYELHLDDQAEQHGRDWEGITRQSLNNLSDVIMNVSLPNSVRHAAAKEFLGMEAFTVNNYLEHWKEANERLKQGLHPLGYKHFIERVASNDLV